MHATASCWDKKNGHGTISWLHMSTVVHNSATMQPVHKIIEYTMYIQNIPGFLISIAA
jgi:hypothetical protein